MTRHTKALLFSALVFPGLGQCNLKRYKSGFILIGVTLVSFIFIMANVMTIASSIANKIVAGEMSAEYSVIRKTILDQQANSDLPHITLFTYLLIAAWLISIIDILRLKAISK